MRLIRDSQTTGEPLRTRENLGGFVIAYERELLPKRLSLGMSKPFYFNSERFDTPFEENKMSIGIGIGAVTGVESCTSRVS